MWIRLDPALTEKIDDICIGVVVAEDVDNRTANGEIQKYLDRVVGGQEKQLEGLSVRDLPELELYHRTFSALGMNPAKYPVSIEALLTRIAKNSGMPSVSPVVDLANAVSLEHHIPLGAHDIDTFEGDLEIRFARENDTAGGDGPLEPEEVVYAAGSSVRTRRWLWRQTPAGKISNEAKNIVFPIDGFEGNLEQVIKARDALALQLQYYFGCNTRVGLLRKRSPAFKISGLTKEELAVEETIKIMLKGVADHTSADEIREKIEAARGESRPLRVKLGLDPSAPDIHLGHSVVLRKIRQLQDLGHQAIIIIGDYTGRIGDPSGKSKTRKPLSEEEVLANAKTYEEQIFKILDREKTTVRFNSEWLSKMTFADVISLAAKCTVARIMERDDFQKRYVNRQPIAVHEFFYPLMQAYDSVVIKADIELGGTDQTFNVLMGRNIQRDYGQPAQLTLFMPLLEGIDGVEKMSKSLGNYIGISESPASIYEKTMKIPDSLILKYYNLCTDIHPDAVNKIQARLAKGENPRDIKMELALEITRLYCGDAEARAAREHFVQAFQQGVAPDDIPILPITKDTPPGEAIINTLISRGYYKSKSEVRRLFAQNAVSLDNTKVTDPNAIAEVKDNAVLQIGKGKFYRIVISE